MRWGELGGYVDQLSWSLCHLHCSAAAAAGHDCNRLADSPLPPLTVAAAESRLTPRTVYFFLSRNWTSAAAGTRSVCPVSFPSCLIAMHTSAIAATAIKSNATHLKPGSTMPPTPQLVIDEQWTVPALYYMRPS